MEDSTKNSSSYVVLARKWRPTTFADVVGQQHIVRSLKNAINMNRIAGAYLFSGMRGVGKTSMARILSRSINCESGPTPTPCGTCANCREISDGASLDVMEIDAASNRGVDEVREIRDHLQYAPIKCRTKIYIIDEVHMLTREAFNAFLKTLEEPPPNTLFVMATTELNKVPETVKSRCQCFEFRALTDAQITERLSKMATDEDIAVSESILRMITRRSEGSMRDAQSLLDQLAAFSGEDASDESIGVALGLVSREKVWELLDAVIKKDASSAINHLQKLYYSGYDVAVLIREMFEAVRTLTIVKVADSPEKLLEETPDTMERIKDMTSKTSAGRLQQFYDLLLKAEWQCKSAGNMLSVIEMAIIKMVRLDEVVPVDEILASLKNLPSGATGSTGTTGASGSVTRSAPAPEHPQGGQPTANNPVRPPPLQAMDQPQNTQWFKIKNAIISKKPMLITTLESVTGFEEEEGNILLSYAESSPTPNGQDFIAGQLGKNRETIESEIEKVMGRKMPVMFRPIKGNAPQKSEKKKGPDDKERKELLNDPIIQKTAEMFEGLPIIEDEDEQAHFRRRAQ